MVLSGKKPALAIFTHPANATHKAKNCQQYVLLLLLQKRRERLETWSYQSKLFYFEFTTSTGKRSVHKKKSKITYLFTIILQYYLIILYRFKNTTGRIVLKQFSITIVFIIDGSSQVIIVETNIILLGCYTRDGVTSSKYLNV